VNSYIIQSLKYILVEYKIDIAATSHW